MITKEIINSSTKDFWKYASNTVGAADIEDVFIDWAAQRNDQTLESFSLVWAAVHKDIDYMTRDKAAINMTVEEFNALKNSPEVPAEAPLEPAVTPMDTVEEAPPIEPTMEALPDKEPLPANMGAPGATAPQTAPPGPPGLEGATPPGAQETPKNPEMTQEIEGDLNLLESLGMQL